MRPITILMIAAILAIGVGTFTLNWFTQVQGKSSVKLKPGQIEVCDVDGKCTKQDSNNADYDSTWLGITNAGKITGGLGIIAAGMVAAMAQGRKTQLGSGGTAIKKQHAMFAALICLGLTAASLLMVPMGLVKAPGILVALAGHALAAAGAFLLKDEAPRPPMAYPPQRA